MMTATIDLARLLREGCTDKAGREVGIARVQQKNNRYVR